MYLVKMFKILFFLFVCAFYAQAKNEGYEGHSLYVVRVSDMVQVKQVLDLIEDLHLDLWSYAVPGQEGMILVAKEKKFIFEEQLNAIGAEYKIDSQNIKEKIDREEQLLAESSRISRNDSSPGLSFDIIHRYDVIDQYLVDIANRYPNITNVVSAGRSIEGRDIKYLQISTSQFQNQSKPIVVIQSLLHAREWVTLPVSLYAIEKLVLNVTEQDLQSDIDWIILPVANPDGFEFSHTTNRFWRKNRATGFGVCDGVDLNRNFDYNWGTLSSSSPCAETFHGLGPFSEPETQVTRNILVEFGSRISLFLDIHSFGSMILYSFGDGTLPANVFTIHNIGVQMAETIDTVKWSSHPNYRVGNIASILYFVSGGCSDYAQTMIGQGLSYTYELPAYRNNSNTLDGFLVEPEFILQAGYETWEGIKVAARYVARNWWYSA